MRRQPLGTHLFDAGFSDSINPLKANPLQFGDASCNQFMLGEGYRRPFNGFFTQGTGTGSRLMFPFGATYGGLRDYSTVTAQGSLLEDYSNTLFTIGAGEAVKEGIPLSEYALDFTFDPGDVTVATGTIAETTHALTTGEPVFIRSTGTLPLGLVANRAYFAISVTANTFRVANTYKDALAGTAIANVGTQGTGVHSLYGDAGSTPIRASSILQVGYNMVADYFYELVENAGLPRVDTPQITVPTSPSASYLGLINGTVNFKIAAIRDAGNIGVDIDNPAAPVRGIASSASAVVTLINNTVKITFPTAVTGQTHWAVFSTQEGFGGTGAFYRLGWRQTSDADAVWYFGISEATVVAQGGGTRMLEFDYRTGDLLPELAWIQDYEPPPGSHVIRLENIMVVLGAFDGTIGAVSLPNFFESYNPFHLLYFPEPVTAVLQRQIDNYAFVATRNGIYTIQYVGYRGDDLPSATITTISPEVGIAYQHNWCIGAGNIAMFIEGAGIALMRNDGSIDYEFGREVAKFTRTWTAANAKVGFNPTTRSFVFGHQNESVSFCLESGVWSTPVYNSDAGVVANWLAAVNAQGKMYASLDASGTATAYVYDDPTATTRMPICSSGQWVVPQGTGRGNAVYEIASAIDQGNNTEPVITILHKNLFQKYIRGCSVTSASSTLTAPANTFTTAWTGKIAVVTGTDIGGIGVHYLIVRLTFATGATATMANPTTGAAVPAQANASNVFVLIGEYAFAQTPVANREQHLRNLRPAVQDCRSYCVSILQPTDALRGGCYEVAMFGNAHRTSAVNV